MDLSGRHPHWFSSSFANCSIPVLLPQEPAKPMGGWIHLPIPITIMVYVNTYLLWFPVLTEILTQVCVLESSLLSTASWKAYSTAKLSHCFSESCLCQLEKSPHFKKDHWWTSPRKISWKSNWGGQTATKRKGWLWVRSNERIRKKHPAGCLQMNTCMAKAWKNRTPEAATGHRSHQTAEMFGQNQEERQSFKLNCRLSQTVYSNVAGVYTTCNNKKQD